MLCLILPTINGYSSVPQGSQNTDAIRNLRFQERQGETANRVCVQTRWSTVYRWETVSNSIILTCSLMQNRKLCQAPTIWKARAKVLSEHLSRYYTRTLTHWHIVLSSSLKACLLGHFLSFLLHFCKSQLETNTCAPCLCSNLSHPTQQTHNHDQSSAMPLHTAGLRERERGRERERKRAQTMREATLPYISQANTDCLIFFVNLRLMNEACRFSVFLWLVLVHIGIGVWLSEERLHGCGVSMSP